MGDNVTSIDILLLREPETVTINEILSPSFTVYITEENCTVVAKKQ